MKLTLVSVWSRGRRISKFIYVPCDMVESDGRTRVPKAKVGSYPAVYDNLLGCRKGVTFIPGG